MPLFYDGKSLTFLYPEVNVADGGYQTYSIGLGYRVLLENPNVILGANVFYDHTETGYGNSINGFGAGIEVLTPRFDFRFNYQRPENGVWKINEVRDTSVRNDATVVGRTSSTSAPFTTADGVFQNVTTTETISTMRTTTTRYLE